MNREKSAQLHKLQVSYKNQINYTNKIFGKPKHDVKTNPWKSKSIQNPKQPENTAHSPISSIQYSTTQSNMQISPRYVIKPTLKPVLHFTTHPRNKILSSLNHRNQPATFIKTQLRKESPHKIP